jgi:hypothetical protein
MPYRWLIHNWIARSLALAIFSLSYGMCQPYSGCNGQAASGNLRLSITSLNSVTGAVQINGGDSKGPNAPFTWNWGDTTTTQGFFPPELCTRTADRVRPETQRTIW